MGIELNPVITPHAGLNSGLIILSTNFQPCHGLTQRELIFVLKS